MKPYYPLPKKPILPSPDYRRRDGLTAHQATNLKAKMANDKRFRRWLFIEQLSLFFLGSGVFTLAFFFCFPPQYIAFPQFPGRLTMVGGIAFVVSKAMKHDRERLIKREFLAALPEVDSDETSSIN